MRTSHLPEYVDFSGFAGPHPSRQAPFVPPIPGCGRDLLCTAVTAGNLMPGQCEDVECMGTGMIEGLTLTAVADDASAEGECYEGNNRATLEAASCLM